MNETRRPEDVLYEALSYLYQAAVLREIEHGYPAPLIETKGQYADALHAVRELSVAREVHA